MDHSSEPYQYFIMALLLKRTHVQFIRLMAAGILAALLTAQVSTHSLEKGKVTGDKLYVLFNRSACVAVESLDDCPVSWKLPPEFAMYYKMQVNELRLLDPLLDSYKADARCRNALRKTLCAHVAPKCLPDAGKDFGDSRTQCQEIYDSSTCPSILANAFKRKGFCELFPTGKQEKAACVAPDGHINGICPQPKHKMPADLLEYFKINSPIKVGAFQTYENLKDPSGNRLLSTRCLNLIKDFKCLRLYCSKDEEKLLTEHDYEDCEETRECYRKGDGALKKLVPGYQAEVLDKQDQDFRESCLVFPKRGTVKSDAIPNLKSDANADLKFSKILQFLFSVGAVYAAFPV